MRLVGAYSDGDTMRLETMIYLMIMGLIVGAISIPILADITTTTTVTTNDGANWVRLAYVEDATTEEYTFTIDVADDTVTVDSLTGSSDVDTILYADEKGAIIINDGAVVYLADAGAGALGDNVSVTNAGGQLTISDGVNTIVQESPAWAYYPQAGGAYGTFTAGELATNNTPVAVAGWFAGVRAYNGYVSPDYGLVEVVNQDEGVINSVTWVKESE